MDPFILDVTMLVDGWLHCIIALGGYIGLLVYIYHYFSE